MIRSCCDFRDTAGRQFTAEKAAKELRAYRTGRLGPTTRLMRDGVIERGLNEGLLLDIGGGVGALTFELLGRVMTRAVIADASAAYVAAAREEATRRGQTESARSGFRTFVHPPAAIREAIERAGLQLTWHRTTVMWAIDVFQRRT